MNIFKWFANLFRRVMDAARANGLTDEVIRQAMQLAREAATRFADNAARREWAVQMLTERHIPEAVARFAIEAAVQLLKREQKA